MPTESLRHMQLKGTLSELIQGQGLKAFPEHKILSRRADVAVPDRDIAFEVQLSPLSPQEWKWRQDEYARSGVTGVWLWGPDAGGGGAKLRDEGAPVFCLESSPKKSARVRVRPQGHAGFWTDPGEVASLPGLVRAWLDGTAVWTPPRPRPQTEIAGGWKFQVPCWQCGEEMPVCGFRGQYEWQKGYNFDLSAPEVGEVAMAHWKEIFPVMLSRRTPKGSYEQVVCICPSCKVFTGNFYLTNELLAYLNEGWREPDVVLEIPIVRGRHRVSPTVPGFWSLEGYEPDPVLSRLI